MSDIHGPLYFNGKRNVRDRVSAWAQPDEQCIFLAFRQAGSRHETRIVLDVSSVTKLQVQLDDAIYELSSFGAIEAKKGDQ